MSFKSQNIRRITGNFEPEQPLKGEKKPKTPVGRFALSLTGAKRDKILLKLHDPKQDVYSFQVKLKFWGVPARDIYVKVFCFYG